MHVAGAFWKLTYGNILRVYSYSVCHLSLFYLFIIIFFVNEEFELTTVIKLDNSMDQRIIKRQ